MGPRARSYPANLAGFGNPPERIAGARRGLRDRYEGAQAAGAALPGSGSIRSEGQRRGTRYFAGGGKGKTAPSRERKVSKRGKRKAAKKTTKRAKMKVSKRGKAAA